jgi:NADH dehydrogenase
VDALDRVTPTLTEKLSAAAERALEKRGVEVVLGRRVVRVSPGRVELEDGTAISAGTIIWSVGVGAHPLAGQAGMECDKMGRLLVDGNMRLAPGVFALGDIAAVPDGHGGVSPTNAQYALRQGKYLGRRLPAIVAGKRVKPFRYRSYGQLVSLGHRNAVALVSGVPMSGFIAWFLWRSYYLMRLPTLVRKFRVAIDWTLDLIFPPDIAEIPSVDIGPALPDRDDGDS